MCRASRPAARAETRPPTLRQPSARATALRPCPARTPLQRLRYLDRTDWLLQFEAPLKYYMENGNSTHYLLIHLFWEQVWRRGRVAPA